MSLLGLVTFRLPCDRAFGGKLLRFLTPFGNRELDRLTFARSAPASMPSIVFELASVSIPTVVFVLGDRRIEIEISNKTGQERRSPEVYAPIAIEAAIQRMDGLELARLDHVGFNLPWFDGVHPDVQMLRRELALCAAYYRFPTGEQWDFILPATRDEIHASTIDLEQDRHPKLEIVSFDKASTPLVQVDFSVEGQTYEGLVQRFPEGLADTTLRNVWVYLENPCGIDICLVVGEHGGKDWSHFFAGHRLSVHQ